MPENGQTPEDVHAQYRRFGSWETDLAPLRKCVGELKSHELIRPAQAFLSNLEKVDALHMMPFLIAGEGLLTLHWALKYLSGPIEGVTAILQGEQLAPEQIDKLLSQASRIDQANELIRMASEEENFKTEFASGIDTLLEGLVARPSFQKGVELVTLVSVPATWTAFECLARDLWVAALNTGDLTIAQRAFSGVEWSEARDGITSKHVEVGLLARHGFDIRNKLGSLLEAKFRFCDLESMTKAYVAAFSEARRITELFDNPELKMLEKCRHLIVHRGAIIDEKFKRQTKTPQEVGEPLLLETDGVSRFFGGTVECGLRLMSLVDKWIAPDSGT